VRTRRHLEEARGELESVRRRLKEQLGTGEGGERRPAAQARRRAGALQGGGGRGARRPRRSGAEAGGGAAGIGDARAETRRLRARVEELEGQARSTKSSEREVAGQRGPRARLLLDTLLDAAQGLRRELALPPVDVLPADAVATGLDEEGPAADVPTRARLDTDPALLEQLLVLPRAHLIVDGYNVTKNGWETLPLEAQRSRLLRELAPLAARSRAEVTVVFDGAGAVLAAGRCDASRRARAVQPTRRDRRRDRA
jgi:hypothetical protein